MPPLDVMDWLPYLALAAVAAGTRWPGRVGLSAVSLGVLLGPRVQGGWTVLGASARLAGFAAVWLAVWVDAEKLAGRGDGVILLIPVAAGTAVVLGLSGSVVLGSLAGVAALAIAAGAVIGRSDRGAVGVAVTVLGGGLIVGLVYGETPLASALLLASAPAGGWADVLGAPARWRLPLRLTAVGTVVAGAVGVAVWASPGD